MAGTGCAKTAMPFGPEDPKVFHSMLGKDPVSLDPMMAQDPETQQIVKELFDGLVDYDPETLEVIPAVAKSWESSEEGKVWTFHLRKGVYYNAPTPTGLYKVKGHKNYVTANDFKFAWNRVATRDNASPLFYLMEPILGFDKLRDRKADELEGIKVIDDYTLQVELAYPFADFPAMLGHVAFSPVNERNYDLSPSDFAERPIGNGPFEYADWRHGVELVLDRAPVYYGKKPKLDRITFTIYEDEDLALEDFRQGALDDVQIPAGEYGTVVTDPELAPLVQSKPMLGMVYYGINSSLAPLGGNIELRKAVSRSLDRTRLASMTDGPVNVASGIVPSAIPGATEQAWPYPLSRSKARAALRARPGRSVQVRLGFNAESSHNRMVSETVRQLASVGIRASGQPARFSDYRVKLEEGVLPLFLTGWIADYPSPDAVIAPLFSPRKKNGVVGSQNLTRYRSAEITQMLSEARATMGDDARAFIYQEIEEKIAQELPIIPLYELRTRRLVQPWIKGYSRTAFDDTPYELIEIERHEAPAAEHEGTEGAHEAGAQSHEPAAESHETAGESHESSSAPAKEGH